MSDGSNSSSTKENQKPSIYPVILREDITLGPQLGTGSFGSVFMGTWKQYDGTEKIVALKKVFVLEKEAEILSKVRHRNIIEFFGICKSAMDFFIVTELADKGSLFDYLHKKEEEQHQLDFKTILLWATEIATGISYLHSDAVVTILHRDLKSKNVVIDAHLRCKLCDFGTSKDLTHSCTAPTWGGTAAWMSPEMINQNEGLTPATDVWSYGVVLWEMLSKEVPYKDFTEFRIYTLITQHGVTLAIPESCPAKLKTLMRNCWKMQPKDRLSMKKILSELVEFENSPNIQKECQSFIDKEDWKIEIEKQQRQIEDMKKTLVKQKELLEAREKAFKRRQKLELAVLATARNPPADVSQWSEHHTSYWICNILANHGARLLEITQKDLEHLGISKLGSRLEVMRGVKSLKEAHNKFLNFPPLEHSHQLHLAVKSEKELGSPGPVVISIVLMLGIYQRSVAQGNRVKFYLDSDWDDLESAPPHPSSSFLKTVCFCVLDDTSNKPINDPTCYMGPVFATSEWVDVPKETRIRIIANVHFADNVTEPRSTELQALVTHCDRPQNLIVRVVDLKTKAKTTQLNHVGSSPQLRGVWNKRVKETKHALTESDLLSLSLSDKATTSPLKIQEERRRRTLEIKTTGKVNQVDELVSEKKKTPVVGGRSKWTWKHQPRKF